MTPDPQRPRSRARFRAGLVLCALAALALLSGCSPEKAAPEPEEPPRAEESLPAASQTEAPEEEPPEEALSPDGLPLVIPLEAQEPDPPGLPTGAPEAALASEDVVYSDRLDSGAELEIRRVTAEVQYDPPVVFYDVYALTRTPEMDWRVLGLLEGYNHYVGHGLDVAERVPDILGQEGWQISFCIGAAAMISWYFAATPAGAELVLDVGSSQEAEVTDLDGDGQGEAWEFYNHGDTGWSFYDRDESGRYWRYFLTAGPEAPLGAVMVPEKGYVPADREGNPLLGEDGNILGPYVLEDGALHLRMEEPP